MDLVDEFADLGPQLRALSSDQPSQPGDRVPGVTARARRVRRTRVAVAVAATLAVAVPTSVVVSAASRHEATRYADLTTWPDRSVAGMTGALSAVTDWWNPDAHQGEAAHDVRWLYRGPLSLEPGSPAVAVFTARAGGRAWLVASDSTATYEQVRLAHASTQVHWSPNAVELTGSLDHVALYAETGGEGGHSRLFLLADPHADEVLLSQAPLPAAPHSDFRSQTCKGSDGVFRCDLRGVTGQVTATVTSPTYLAGQVFSPLGTGRRNPRLVTPGAPELPSGWHSLGVGFSASAQSQDGSWSSGGDIVASSMTGTHRVAVYARCYGGGSTTLQASTYDMTHDDLGNGTVTSAPTELGGNVVPCDGDSHLAMAPHVISRNTLDLHWLTDRWQALTYTYGYVD